MLKLNDTALLRDKSYVDGKWVGARSGTNFAVTNPANGETLAEVPDLLEGETKDAIEAAHRAFAVWRTKTAKERHALMRKWYELIMAAQEDLARIMTAEQGKPLAESRGEIAYGAIVHRMVRRRGQARLWRRDPAQPKRPPHHRDEGAGGRRRRHHAVEFSQRDDHAQMRARARPPAARW